MSEWVREVIFCLIINIGHFCQLCQREKVLFKIRKIISQERHIRILLPLKLFIPTVCRLIIVNTRLTSYAT